VFSVYFAADKSYVPKAIDLTIKELKRLKTRLLTRVELDMVKAQLKGNLMLTLEATNNRMNRIARQELMLERYVDINKTLRLIDAITARQIRDTAQRILQSGHMTVCSLGPTTQKDLAQIDFSSL
jgi:predicted Zn-dependent peptidase